MREWLNGGYLYAIAAVGVQRVKIGIATDPGVRMTSLRTASPVPLHLHSATWHRDPLTVERDVHTRLRHARLHGEWFDMQAEEVGRWLGTRPRSQEGEPRGVTICEAANWVGVREGTIRDWVRTGRLRATQYGARIYIAPIDLERLRRRPVAA
jgi:excisionase family DNA binding protein